MKNNLDKIYVSLQDSIFSPKDVMSVLNVAPNTATKYIDKLKKLNLLQSVKGVGHSKYHFI